LKTKAIRYFQTDRTLTRIVSPPLYQKELNESDAAKAFIDKIKAYSKVTLLYASKEQERNHANVLKHYLDTHL